MIYQGTVHNGVVILSGDPPLPEGATVRVIPIDAPPQLPADPNKVDPLFRMSELAVETGIPDLASQADYYLNDHAGDNDAR